MHYNPRIYNFSNLSNRDRVEVSYLLESTLDSIHAVYAEYSYELDLAETTLDKIRYEERIAVIKEITRSFLDHVIEIMVGLIDEDEAEIKEKDTNDYFYGYTWSIYASELGIFDEDFY